MAHIRRRHHAYSLLALIVVGIAVFPLYWMLVTATTPTSALFAETVQALPRVGKLSIFLDVVKSAEIIRWLSNSLVISSGTTLLVMILALPVAYGLSRFKFRGRNGITLLFLITQMLPESLLVISIFAIFKAMNLLDSYLGLILADGAFTLPIAILIVKGGIDAIPFAIDESARLDGCGTVGILLRIITPLVGPATAAAGVITFFNCWNEFVFAISFMFDPSKQPMSVGLVGFFGEFSTPMDLVMASALVYTLPAAVFYILVQKRVVSGVMAGGVKG